MAVSQKKKPVNTTQTSRHSTVNAKRMTFIVLLALTAVIVSTGFVIARNKALDKQAEERQYQEDVRRFAEVEKDMDEAYKSIVASVGEPSKMEKIKSCSRVSLKFDEGQLNCSNNLIFVVGVNSDTESLNLTDHILRAVNTTNAMDYKPVTTSRISSSDDYSTTLSYTKHDFKCQFKFSKQSTNIVSEYDFLSTRYAAKYIYGCSKKVNRAVY